MSVKVNSDTMDKLMTELKRRKYFSPDFSFYRFYTTQLFFAFDHLRYGGFEYKEFLKDAVWLGRACTTKDTYVMEDMTTCTISGTRRKVPIVYEEKGEQSATIHGDVFLIAPEHLIALDDNLINDGLLERVKVQAYMLDQNVIDTKRIKNLFGKPYADMWTYFVDKEFFFEEERLSKISDLKTPDSYGHAVATGGAIKSWDRPYFEYTNTDILNARIKKEEKFGGPFGRTTKQDYMDLFHGDTAANLEGWEGWMGEAEWNAKMSPSYADYGYGD